MERSLQKMSSFNKAYSDGKGIGSKSEKSYQKYSQSETKMENPCKKVDRTDVCEALEFLNPHETANSLRLKVVVFSVP